MTELSKDLRARLAERFTVELWFKWAGGGLIAATAGYPQAPDYGGIEAYPLVTKGMRAPAGPVMSNSFGFGGNNCTLILGAPE